MLIATEKEINLERLGKRAERLVNAKVLWRHNHPYKQECRENKKPCDIYGYIGDVRLEPGKLFGKVVIENETDSHRKLMEIVQEPSKHGFEKIGASIAFIEYEDGRIYGEEVSITPLPACPICLTPNNDNRKILEKLGEKELTDEKDGEAIIKLTKDIAALENTVKEMEQVVITKEGRIGELEEKVIEFGKLTKEMEETITKQKDELDYIKTKAPLIAKITTNEEEADLYKSLPVKTLENLATKMEAMRKTSNIQVSSMEDTAAESSGKSPGEFIKKVAPDLYAELEESCKKRGKTMKEVLGER